VRRLSLLAALLATIAASGTAVASGASHGGVQVRSGRFASGTSAVTSAQADSHVRRAVTSARVRRALGPTGELRSVALNNVSNTDAALTQVGDFPRMARDGITSVTVYVYLYVDSPTSSSVHTGLLTPTDQELQVVSAAAQLSGLGVHLMPVLIDPTQACRCEYQPADVRAFFASYTVQLEHYADLSTSLGVPLLFVGSENDGIARYTSEWRALIADVRRHYSGALGYMSTGYMFFTARFWDALDIAAVSPYYSLGNEKVQSYQRMMKAWNNDHLPYLARVAKAVRIPLVLGEIGYRSETGGYTSPAHANNGLPSPQVQAEAYRALLDAVAKSPFLYGVSFWRWGHPGSTPVDNGYSPAGKPAECVLAARWSTDSTVQQLAKLPVCDLSVVDSATVRVTNLTSP
jgi:hypothetical protein